MMIMKASSKEYRYETAGLYFYFKMLSLFMLTICFLVV